MDLLAASAEGRQLIGYGAAGQRHWHVRREGAALLFQSGLSPDRLRERRKEYASPQDAARALHSEVYRKLRAGLVELGAGERLGDLRLACCAPHAFRSDVLAYSDRLGMLAVAVQQAKIREAQIHMVDVASGRMQLLCATPPRALLDRPLIYSMGFSPDGTKLAYTIDDDTWQVHCYNLDTGEDKVLSHPNARNRVPLLRTLAWTPAGALVCLAGDDLAFINPDDGQVERRVAIPTDEEHHQCCHASLSADGRMLSLTMCGRRVTSGPSQIRLYDTETGRLIQTIQPALADIAFLSQIEQTRFSADARHLLVVFGLTRGPYMIEIATGQVVHVFTSGTGDHIQSCVDMSLSPDGAWLAVAGYRQVLLYDYALRELLYQEHYGAHLGKILLSQDKRLLIYGGTSGEIVVRSTGIAYMRIACQ